MGANFSHWNAIKLMNANAVYDTNGLYQSGDILKFVDLSFGKVVVDGSIHIESSSISNSDGTGLSLIHEDSIQLAPMSKILKTKISNHAGDGVNILSHHFLIDSCEISNNFQAIDFLYAPNAYLGLGEISNSKILNHLSNGIVYSYEGDFLTTDTIVIQGNLIYNCQDAAILHFKSGRLHLRKNFVIGNRLGIHFRGASLVDSNVIANTWGGIPVRLASQLINTVRNNSICFNDSKDKGGCGILYVKGAIIEHNTVTMNKLTIQSTGNRNAAIQSIDFHRYGFERVNFNNIFGNDSEYEFQTAVQSIDDAYNNYWGTTRDTCIAKKIYDRLDAGPGTGFVRYSPFLTEADTNCPISPPSLVGKELSPLGDLMLYWKPNPESDVAGYKIYWSNPTGYSFDTMVDVGNTDHFVLKGITDTNATYTVTAYDNGADGYDDMLEGHESWYSPAVSTAQNDVIRINSCGSVVSPSGRIWSQTGMYFDTVQPVVLCEDINAYFVRIGNETTSNIQAHSCGDYISPSGNHLWTTAGNYTDTVLNSSGCDSIISINLNIFSKSTSSLDTTICGSMVSPSRKYIWSTAGLYLDTISNHAGCDSIITVRVRNNFIKNLQNSNGLLVSGNTGISYQWLDCNNNYAPIIGATGINFTPTTNGSYALAVNDGSCSDTTNCILVADVGVKNKDVLNEILYYPNPSKGKINVDLGSTFSGVKVELINPEGKIIKTYKWEEVQQFEVDLIGSKGYYSLRIFTAHGGEQNIAEIKVLKN
jgi:hypothetical protein